MEQKLQEPCEFRISPVNEETAAIIHALEESADNTFLPPGFDIIPQLLLLLNDQEASSQALVDLIHIDAGLTANVIRVANSAAVGGSCSVETVGCAILRLGFREIYLITLRLITSPLFTAAPQTGVVRLNLCEHALAGAVAARHLARLLGEDPEIAFTAALLHDVGKILLCQQPALQYVVLAERCKLADRPLFLAERALYRTDHAALGARLLVAWNFPENIVLPVTWHHEPLLSPKPQRRLASIIYCANIIAHRLTSYLNLPPYAVVPDHTVLDTLGLNPKELLHQEPAVREGLNNENARLA